MILHRPQKNVILDSMRFHLTSGVEPFSISAAETKS